MDECMIVMSFFLLQSSEERRMDGWTNNHIKCCKYDVLLKFGRKHLFKSIYLSHSLLLTHLPAGLFAFYLVEIIKIRFIT